MFRIHCLMVGGGSLDDIMRTKLYQVARDMLTRGDKIRRFRTSYMEGAVTSEFKYGSMGFIWGTICEAEFECDDHEKKITVRYIIREPYMPDSALDQGKWMSMKEFLEELDKESKTNPSFRMAMNAHNN